MGGLLPFQFEDEEEQVVPIRRDSQSSSTFRYKKQADENATLRELLLEDFDRQMHNALPSALATGSDDAEDVSSDDEENFEDFEVPLNDTSAATRSSSSRLLKQTKNDRKKREYLMDDYERQIQDMLMNACTTRDNIFEDDSDEEREHDDECEQ